MADFRVLSDQQRHERLQQRLASLSGVGHSREETEGHWFPLMQTTCVLAFGNLLNKDSLPEGELSEMR
jgi:hypothetical protein